LTYPDERESLTGTQFKHINIMKKFLTLLLSAVLISLCVPAVAGGRLLVPNGDFETANKDDNWPDGWPKLKAGGSWEEEEGNRFLRLQCTEPGAMVMMYREIHLPENVDAIELTFRQRITDLKLGENVWFDARIMMEFMDGAREKVSPGPPVPYTRKDTAGWENKSVRFLVPEGATILKFMPALFNVKSGTWDLDDIEIRAIDPAPIKAAAEEAAVAKAEKLANDTAKRRAKAAAVLEKNGTLIGNGDFETPNKKNDFAQWWGSPSDKTSWPEEDGNRFLRLVSTKPGELVMVYRTYDIPGGVEAMELSWRQRVTGLKKGEQPWFDARFMFDFLDASGEKLAGKPGPSYTQRDTDGWVDRSKSFLVPEEAVTLVMMPCLFQVKAGTFDIDDLKLVPIDPAVLQAAAEEQKKIEAARYVEPEEPDKTKWPKTLHVEGNLILDEDGEEVWLQGVNVVGLESLPFDRQIMKSTKVSIEDWKSNCIRLPVKEEFWFGTSFYQKDGGEAYRKQVDDIITFAANRGVYVALDLHRFRAPKQEHADFWKDAAMRYKNHPAVLFDVFNEPHGISWEVWRDGGIVGRKEGVDESAFLSEEEKKKNQGFESIGMQGLVDAVRSVGARNIIIAGGVFWCNDLTGIVNGYALDDATGNGIVYSWHTYNWHPGWARVLPVVEKHPVFLGECGGDEKPMGFIPLEDQEDPHTFNPDLLGFVQKHKIHWTGFCLAPNATPRLILDWNYTPTPFWGQYAKDALNGKKFEMKKMR
jgi:endoglucanase